MGAVINRLLHRRLPTPAPGLRPAVDLRGQKNDATTVPQVLGRWPSAPAGSCDICNCDISSGETHRVPATEFKGIMRQGYNPFVTGRAPRIHMLWGVSSEDAYADWRLLVVRDTTDWGLCADCAEDVARFVVAHGKAQRVGRDEDSPAGRSAAEAPRQTSASRRDHDGSAAGASVAHGVLELIREDEAAVSALYGELVADPRRPIREPAETYTKQLAELDAWASSENRRSAEVIETVARAGNYDAVTKVLDAS